MPKGVMTVLGEISADELGLVLPHEHLLWEMFCFLNEEPREIQEKEKLRQPVKLENRGHVVYHAEEYADNLCLTDINVAIEEALNFKFAGGKTICDLTNKNWGRDPRALFQIAISTGLNVIMGSSNYVSVSCSNEDKKMSIDQIKNEIINEFKNGVGSTGIKPGIIGEVGAADINDDFEMRNLRASGMAQCELDCPMNIHPAVWTKDGHKILDILEEVGVDLNKVVLSHFDGKIDDYDYADSIAKRGVYVEYDSFGASMMLSNKKFLPCDTERIRAVMEMVKRGNINRILISHDICFKIEMTKWGGHGYSHILENIVPRLRQEGLKDDKIKRILLENPKRWLTS